MLPSRVNYRLCHRLVFPRHLGKSLDVLLDICSLLICVSGSAWDYLEEMIL